MATRKELIFLSLLSNPNIKPGFLNSTITNMVEEMDNAFKEKFEKEQPKEKPFVLPLIVSDYFFDVLVNEILKHQWGQNEIANEMELHKAFGWDRETCEYKVRAKVVSMLQEGRIKFDTY
jgi:hypothetical protein